MTEIERAGELMASAAVGDLQLLRCLGFVLGPPIKHMGHYERALVTACDAGQIGVVTELLNMGVVPIDGHAMECAKREGHLDIINVLTRFYKNNPTTAY